MQCLIPSFSSRNLARRTGAAIAQGEVAVNYNVDSPALYIQDSNGNVIKLADAGASSASKVQSVSGEAPIIVDNGDPLNQSSSLTMPLMALLMEQFSMQGKLSDPVRLTPKLGHL